MKRFLTSRVLTAALLAMTAALPGRAQEGGGDGDCPNERATAIAGHSVEIGPIYKCVGVYHFGGRQIRIDGPTCPSGRLRYPDRSVCAGETEEGARCREIGMLPVSYDSCKCTFLQLFDLTLPLLVCRCDQVGVVGHVSTAATFPCTEERG